MQEGATVPLAQVLGEPSAHALWLVSSSHVLMLGSTANQTSEEACSKANLKTTTTKRENGRQNFCFVLLLKKQCKTVAIVDMFFCQVNHSS